MAESSRRYNLRDTRKKPQGLLLKRWEVEYSKLISNENRRIPLETVQTAIRSAFDDGMFEQWRITLKCPLSGQRIKVPARYADCTHIECFDLEAFLRMKTQKNIRVCPICQKEIEKPLTNLRIDKYIETVLSTIPDATQVELLRDGSFTEVHEEFVVAMNVINDEEPFVQDSNTSFIGIKQEVLQDDDDYITLSDAEDESIEEIAIIDVKPISLMPLNMDIKPKITSSPEPEQIHFGEDQETQDQHNAATQKANIYEHAHNCSNSSATITQSNVKTEPEDVDTSEVEILGAVKIRKKRKAPSKSDAHTSQISRGFSQQNVKPEGESSSLQQMKHAKTDLVSDEPIPDPSETNQDSAQIPDLKGRKDQEERIETSASTVANLTNQSATRLLQQTSRPSNIMDTSAAAKLTNKIVVSGPCLYPEHERPWTRQIEELQAYFSLFGKINHITVLFGDSKVVFDNCDSAAECIRKGTHNIRGHDFHVCAATPSNSMKKRLRAIQNMSDPSDDSVSAPNINSDPPAESSLGNQLPQATTSISTHFHGSVMDYSNPESETKRIYVYGKHKILGRPKCGFRPGLVLRGKPFIRGMNAQIRAQLNQNMAGPSSENVSTPNIEVNPPTESMSGINGLK